MSKHSTHQPTTKSTAQADLASPRRHDEQQTKPKGQKP